MSAATSGTSPAVRLAYAGYKKLDPSLQRAHEDGARGTAVELHRIAAGGRVLRRHLHDLIDLVVADLQTLKRVRDTELLAQLQHEIHEGAEARPQANVGGEPLHLVLDGLAIEREHIRCEHRIGEPMMRAVERA